MPETFKLDVKDKKLLLELEKDARVSMSEIGRKIGVSKEVANYRLKRLIDKGVIKRFYLLTDDFALNYKVYRLTINLHNLKENTRGNIVRDLRKLSNIEVNIFLESKTDIEILLHVKHTSEFYEFYQEFLEKYGEFIFGKDLEVVTKRYFLNNRYLLGNIKERILGNSKNILKIDKKEEKILESLKENPRESVLEIAKKQNMAPSTVIYHIKNLKKNKIIIGYRIALNLGLLGYNKCKIGILLSDLSKKQQVINYLLSKDEVTNMNEFIGEMDLDFEVVFKTLTDLDKLLENLRIHSPYIKDYDITNLIED